MADSMYKQIEPLTSQAAATNGKRHPVTKNSNSLLLMVWG